MPHIGQTFGLMAHWAFVAGVNPKQLVVAFRGVPALAFGLEGDGLWTTLSSRSYNSQIARVREAKFPAGQAKSTPAAAELNKTRRSPPGQGIISISVCLTN